MTNEPDGNVRLSKNEFYSRVKAARTNLHPNHWPEDVNVVSLEGLEYLGLDSKGHLYLDGDRVYSTRRWSNGERLIAIAGVAAAFIAAVASLITAWNSSAPKEAIDANQVEVVTPDTDAPLDLVLQVLGERADDTGVVAVTYPDNERWKGVLGAGGAPVELGILSFKKKRGEQVYEAVAFFGNLSSTHLGECNVSVSLTAKDGESDYIEVPFAGYFKSGKASVFGFDIPSSLPDAKQITLSKLRCDEKLYEDGPAPQP